MVNSNCLPGEERFYPLVHPDTWAEPPSISFPYENIPSTTPATSILPHLALKRCYPEINTQLGLSEPSCNLLDGAAESHTHNFLSSPLDPYYMLESTFFNVQEACIGTHQNKIDASSEFLFSSACIGYEGSLSPSSSRPCTAGYDGDEMSFLSAPSKATSFFSDAYVSTSNDTFPFLAEFDHNVVNPGKLLKSTTESIQNSFPDLCLSPYAIQSPNGLLTSPDEPLTLAKPDVDLEFTGLSTFSYSAGATEIDEKNRWASGLESQQRPQVDGSFATGQVFSSRCVQPNGLVIQRPHTEKKDDFAFDISYSAYGQTPASFLPGNWAPPVACGDNNGKDSLMKKGNSSIRKGSSVKKQAKLKRFPLETPCMSNTIKGTLKAPCPLPSQYHEASAETEDASDLVEDKVKEKKIDGKYVCDRISKGTGEVCGKKFQRSEHLKRHWATHTNLKPYQCRICQRYFGRTDNLNQHRKTHANAHGRNTKLLNAQRLEKADQKRSLDNTERGRTINQNHRTLKL